MYVVLKHNKKCHSLRSLFEKCIDGWLSSRLRLQFLERRSLGIIISIFRRLFPLRRCTCHIGYFSIDVILRTFSFNGICFLIGLKNSSFRAKGSISIEQSGS